MKGGDYFRRAIVEYLIGMVLGAVFIVAACATLTDPPKNWPTSSGPDPTALPMPDDGHQPIDISARRAVDGGR